MLQRSEALDAAFTELLGSVHLIKSPRVQVTESICGIAIEHGRSIRALIASGHPTSATALLRLQFETATRAVWLIYTGSDEWALRYHAPAGQAPVKEPDTPSMTEMLDSIRERAPPAVFISLNAFKAGSWKAMNSYVHGGIHPFIYMQHGYLVDFLIQTLRNSNGLSGMAAMVFAMMSGDAGLARSVREVQEAHLDCFPPLNI